VAAAVARVRERIADAGADPGEVTLVAVTKGQPLEAVEAALEAGLTDLGESRPQELVAKADALAERGDPAVRWHCIGRLQRNKVRTVAPLVHLWQSVDRLSLAGEIARHAPGAAVLVQVNVSGAEQQGGCPPERVASVVEGCTDLGLEVRGLMAIGAHGPAEDARPGFRTLRDLADRLGLPERSMGMSGDLEVAVEEGATIVRVGSALFEPRGGSAAMGN
jgi:pyridoxal phosphate enzyme (YggS family)